MFSNLFEMWQEESPYSELIADLQTLGSDQDVQVAHIEELNMVAITC
jgi:hypothetical protein